MIKFCVRMYCLSCMMPQFYLLLLLFLLAYCIKCFHVCYWNMLEWLKCVGMYVMYCTVCDVHMPVVSVLFGSRNQLIESILSCYHDIVLLSLRSLHQFWVQESGSCCVCETLKGCKKGSICGLQFVPLVFVGKKGLNGNIQMSKNEKVKFGLSCQPLKR